MSVKRRFIAFMSGATATAVAASALAQDGSYGRIEGDLAVQVDLGAAIGEGRAQSVVAATLRYVQTGGIYAAMWSDPWAADPRHTASLGLELRPLFLPRFLKNLEQGPAWLDLTIDSLALRLGVVPYHDSDMRLRQPGFEAGLGVAAPLDAQASGPWISASAVHRWANDDFILAQSEPHWFFVVALGFQQVFYGGAVDFRDKRPR